MNRPSRVADAPPRVAYTVRETADMLRMPYKAALRLIHEKRLHAVWTGRQYVVPVAAVDDFLAA